MIQHVTSTAPNGEVLSIDLYDRTDTGLVFLDVTGLGPPKAIISVSEGPTQDGARVNNARTTKRNIVVTFAIDRIGNEDIENTRIQSVYPFFPIKQKIQLAIETTHRYVYTDAWIESNETKIFASVPHNIISLICPDSYLTGVESEEVVLAGVDGLFEFPFSNESLVEPLLEFGNMNTYVGEVITYVGDAETGVTIDLDLFPGMGDIHLYNNTYNEEMILDVSIIENIVGSPVQYGDVIEINTKHKEKSMTFVRGGDEYNILNAGGLYVTWISLRPGINSIGLDCDGGVYDIRATLRYNPLYEGV